MKALRASAVLRRLMWRAGRKAYTYARGDGQNEPRTNGEYRLLECVLGRSSSPKVLLDIGANVGDWTAHALASNRPPATLHIHAFEPSRATRANLAMRFSQTVEVSIHPYAVSDGAGEAPFYSAQDGAGTNSLSPVSGRNEEVVGLVTIDQFLAQLGIVSVALVKVDAEGFDLSVLRGAEESLRAGRIDIVQFEYNWRWLLNHACLRDVFDLIAGKSYRLGKLVGDGVELYEEWHFELDRFFENNYVLIRNGSDFCLPEADVYFDPSNVGLPAPRKTSLPPNSEG